MEQSVGDAAPATTTVSTLSSNTLQDFSASKINIKKKVCSKVQIGFIKVIFSHFSLKHVVYVDVIVNPVFSLLIRGYSDINFKVMLTSTKK